MLNQFFTEAANWNGIWSHQNESKKYEGKTVIFIPAYGTWPLVLNFLYPRKFVM